MFPEERGRKMTFEEAQQREDYFFTLNGIEDLIPGIRKNWMEAMDEDSVPYNGCAVLTIGYVDIEVNVHTEEQIARNNCQPGNKTPVVDYFTCRKIGRSPDDWESDRYLDEYPLQVDWNADNWAEQLEKDMFKALDQYVSKENVSYNHPNLSTF